MLQTSRDLLNVVLSFAVLWIAIFLGWFLFYLILIMRDIRGVTHEVQEKVVWCGDLIKLLKEKLQSSTATIALLMRSALELVNYYRSRVTSSVVESMSEEPTEEKKKGKKK